MFNDSARTLYIWPTLSVSLYTVCYCIWRFFYCISLFTICQLEHYIFSHFYQSLHSFYLITACYTGQFRLTTLVNSLPKWSYQTRLLFATDSTLFTVCQLEHYILGHFHKSLHSFYLITVCYTVCYTGPFRHNYFSQQFTRMIIPIAPTVYDRLYTVHCLPAGTQYTRPFSPEPSFFFYLINVWYTVCYTGQFRHNYSSQLQQY